MTADGALVSGTGTSTRKQNFPVFWTGGQNAVDQMKRIFKDAFIWSYFIT